VYEKEERMFEESRELHVMYRGAIIFEDCINMTWNGEKEHFYFAALLCYFITRQTVYI
jgi:hypothetical protein